MSHDYFACTLLMPLDELPLEPPDYVAYSLPDAIGDRMEGPDCVPTSSLEDALHYLIRTAAQVFATSALDFLNRDPWDRPDVAAIREESDGFVISALLPADIPAALAAIEAWLHDTERYKKVALDYDYDYAEKIVQWRDWAIAAQDQQSVSQCDPDFHFFWFLLKLRTLMLRAQAENLAVVHARYIWLEAHWDRLATTQAAKAADPGPGERSS